MVYIVRKGIDGSHLMVVEYTYLPTNTQTMMFLKANTLEDAKTSFAEHFRDHIDRLDNVRDLTDVEWKEYWWNLIDQHGKRIRSWNQVEAYLKHYN